jgi:hypothetical protein
MTKKRTDPTLLSNRRALRSALRRQAEISEREASDQARKLIAQKASQSDKANSAKHTSNAVVFATAKLCSAVGGSFGLSNPINITTTSGKTSAYTDFRSVTVSVADKQYDIDNFKEVGKLLHFTKGLIYHELGHIQHTVPLADLYAAACDPDNDKYVAPFDVSIGKTHRKAWNILEDQRMECAVVRTSPIVSQYLQLVVLDYVVSQDPKSAWPFIAGRTYLPKNIIRQFRDEALDYAYIHQLDIGIVNDIRRVISSYKKSTNATEMMDLVCEFADLMHLWYTYLPPEGVDTHTYDQTNGDNVQEKLDGSADPSPQQEQGDQEQGDQEQGDTYGGSGSASDQHSEESQADSSSESGTQSSTTQDPVTNQDTEESYTKDKPDPYIKDAVRQEMEDLVDNGPVTDNDIKEFMSIVNDELRRSLPHNVGTVPMPDDAVAVANEVHSGMMLALEALAVQIEPSWRFNQEHGILDPTRFLLRDPGETDFWCGLDGEGAQGYNLAVSIVLDVSYSMIYNIDAVSTTALGIRKACDELGIPSTVTTFSNTAKVLWAHDEDAHPVYVRVEGNTYARTALSDIENQQLGCARHLVIILTDGEWDDVHSLREYSAPGRFFLLVGLNIPSIVIESKNPDAYACIKSPSELADHATRALSLFLA